MKVYNNSELQSINFAWLRVEVAKWRWLYQNFYVVTILPLGSSKRGREGRKNLPTSRDCGVGMLDTTEIGASSSNKVDNRETL